MLVCAAPCMQSVAVTPARLLTFEFSYFNFVFERNREAPFLTYWWKEIAIFLSLDNLVALFTA